MGTPCPLEDPSSPGTRSLTRSRVRAPRAPAGRIPRGPSSKTAPPGPRTERIQPPRRSPPSTSTTWRGVALWPRPPTPGEGAGPAAAQGIRGCLPPGAYLGGFGGAAQVVAGGQAADASAQHDHGPAHRELRRAARRADRLPLCGVAPRSPPRPLLCGKLRQGPRTRWWEREAPFGAQTRPRDAREEVRGPRGCRTEASRALRGKIRPHPCYRALHSARVAPARPPSAPPPRPALRSRLRSNPLPIGGRGVTLANGNPAGQPRRRSGRSGRGSARSGGGGAWRRPAHCAAGSGWGAGGRRTRLGKQLLTVAAAGQRTPRLSPRVQGAGASRGRPFARTSLRFAFPLQPHAPTKILPRESTHKDILFS